MTQVEMRFLDFDLRIPISDIPSAPPPKSWGRMTSFMKPDFQRLLDLVDETGTKGEVACTA